MYSAETTGEVVMCAGAVGSPHLLPVSGVGPRALLRTEVHVDLPGVGKNLADHPVATVTYAATKPMAPGVNNHGDVLAALRSDPGQIAPDIHIIFRALGEIMNVRRIYTASAKVRRTLNHQPRTEPTGADEVLPRRSTERARARASRRLGAVSGEDRFQATAR